MKVYLYVEGEEVGVVEKPALKEGHTFMVTLHNYVETYQVQIVNKSSAMDQTLRWGDLAGRIYQNDLVIT